MSTQTLQFRQIATETRWDAEFYSPNFAAIRDALLACGSVPLRHFIKRAGRGVGPAYDPAGSVRVINSVNVRDLEISEDRQSRVRDVALAENPDAVVLRGDLMVTSTGIGTLGRVFCNLGDETYFADGHITILRLHDPKMAPYLCAFLQSSLGRIQFVQRRRGSSRQVEIYPEDILSVLVPPFPQLREYVSDEWQTAVDDFSRARTQYPQAEEKILSEIDWTRIEKLKTRNHFVGPIGSIRDHSRLDPEFFSPRNNEIERALVNSGAIRFRDLECAYVKGVQPDAYSNDGDITVIKSKDIVRTGINIATCDRASAAEVEVGQGVVQRSMLAMNMTGVGTLGRAAVIPEITGATVLSVDVSGWVLNTKTLPVDYVSLFLNSPIGMEQTLRYQTGSSGQLHLYPEHIRNLWIFVKRDHRGRIAIEWHDELASQVQEASIARQRGVSRLQAIHSRFTEAVGLNPRLIRE